ncbi:unnamed protein product [Ixodes pacificus]
MPARLDASASCRPPMVASQRWHLIGEFGFAYLILNWNCLQSVGAFFPRRGCRQAVQRCSTTTETVRKSVCVTRKGGERGNISRRRKRSGEEDPVALKPDAIVAFSTETLSRFDAF